MRSRGNHTGERRPAARRYLLTPPVTEPADEAALAEGLAAADVAAVLLRLAEADDRTLVRRAQALAPLVQERGAARVRHLLSSSIGEKEQDDNGYYC